MRFEAKVDTGAEYCMFQRVYGEAIGLTIESGDRLELSSLTDTFVAFGHSVTIKVLGRDFELKAYFPERDDLRRDLLGRVGWLHQTRLGIVDHDERIYLSKYDD